MPSITTWTRFEPQTRNAALTTSVQGRIHDPLWLLARQWQVGEFQGQDSGTPIMARLRSDVSRLTRFFPGPIAANSQVTAPAFNAKVTPLETMVERERVRPLAGAKGENCGLPWKLRSTLSDCLIGNRSRQRIARLIAPL
jgi:hypothetical protein